MPGFAVRNVGVGPPMAERPKTKFSWHLNQVFGDYVVIRGQRALTPIVYAKDCTLPTMFFKQGSVKGASLDYKYAQAAGFDDVRIVWYDTIGLRDIIKGWTDRIWNEETGIQPAATYKKITQIKHYDYKDEKYDLWVLHNSWPSRVAAGQLSYVDNEINLVETVVTYDWATKESEAEFVG